ncbi:MAG: tRNA-guanine transglycosylase, partial [Candidatus Omnitrophica bacterium]|nr:tRNA-guanine transglycosylase [Candidatus Omnitrophota bacterium]
MNAPFTLLKMDPQSRARRGRLKTFHGDIETPDFMPVGTQATVKTLRVSDLKECGSQMILANAYHLWLRPGPEVIRAAGGLHRFMGWDGGLLTDSGGFQVFSLSGFRKVTEEGVTFQSPLDGARHRFTPESVMEFQRLLGGDVIVPLDECVRYPCEAREAEDALERTFRWLKRSVAGTVPTVPSAGRQLFFGIVQGA